MATDITLRLAPGCATAADPGGAGAAASAADRALAVFGEVERACTRFGGTSPLARANDAPSAWHRVPPLCLEAVREAWCAYEETGGRFDPRVHDDLIALGYDRSLPFADGQVVVDRHAPRRRLARPPWRPRFRTARRELCLGGAPVDLGGIGKGLALRWAADVLRPTAPDFVLNAGGDCLCAGAADDGAPWRVGVEDPAGGTEPVAVLGLTETASATSSVRVRHWEAGGVAVHHLIDPATGLPGGQGLGAVTVVAPDPARAEVWSKALFLWGATGIARQAARRGLAALWVAADGTLGTSPAMERWVLWTR